MTLAPWKFVRRLYEIRNPWWTYRADIVELPSGKEGEYHYVHVRGSSMIVPILDDGRMILVNQYRYLVHRESLEFPCGSVKEGSTFEETARHELAEETGRAAEELAYVGEFNSYNGVTDEMCKIYVARRLSTVKAQHDETEEFEHVQLSSVEIEEYIRSGKIWDGMTLAAWAIIRERVKG